MKKEFTKEEATQIAAQINLDFTRNNVDPEQFRLGLAIEFEHGTVDARTNVTNDDPAMTGKIAWAHLNEIPDYYTRLEKMEKEAGS